MKRLFVTLLISFLPVASAYSQRKSDRELNGLIGPVRSVHIIKTIYSKSHKRAVESFTYLYDADGIRADRPTYTILDYIGQGGSLEELENPDKLPEIVGLNPDGSLRYKEVYTFDGNGNRTSKARYDSAGTLDNKRVYTYDDKGRKVEEAYYTTEEYWASKAVYGYDERGNKVSETYYKASGMITGKMGFKYDEKGRVIEDVLYDAKGMIERKMVYGYDARGKKTEETSYGADGNIASQWISEYKYDKTGNWIEMASRWTSGGRLVQKETIHRSISYY
jgi:hypothetical protein